MNQLISIMGTMGVGKTTAATLISHHLNLPLVTENFADNAFLPRFYKDMPRWAFHSQTFFLLEKIKQLSQIESMLKTSSVIQDIPIAQDVFSYAQAQYELKNMDEAEWQLYCTIFFQIINHLPAPDLIVYLDATLTTIFQRVKQRNRQFEYQIPDSYITLLDTLNKKWIAESQTIRMVQINTDNLNIVDNQSDQREFLRLVDQALKDY